MARVKTLLIVGAISAQWACGTDVNVGRNNRPELFKLPGTEEVGEVAEDESSTNAQNADALALNCTEQVPESELSPHIRAFCAETPAEQKSVFALAYDRVCVRRDIVRMTESACAWDGTQKLERYFRVLDKTNLEDRNLLDFNMLAAFAIKIPRTPDEYLYALYRGYDDPSFKAQIKKLDAFKLSNVSVDRAAGTIDYNMEAQTSAATAKFRGRILVKKLSSGMVAVYDQAVAEKVVIKEQRYLLLLVPVDEESSVVLAVDDKIVNDMGNHQIAYSTAVKINKDRMEFTHAMANLKIEVPAE